jgi:hypothetical protein
VRIPLGDFGGIDLSHIKSVRLNFGVSTALTGSIQFADLAFAEQPGGGIRSPG